MASSVNLPDGSVLNLPRDDMTPDEVNAEVQKLQAQQAQQPPPAGQPPGAPPQWPAGPGRETALDASAALKGGTEGVFGTVNTMTAPITAPIKAAAGWLAPWLVGDDPQKQQQFQQQLNNFTDAARLPIQGERAAGLIDRPDLVPQNARERYTTAGIEGTTSMLPALAAPESLGARVKTAIQGLLGGVGGQGATDIAQGANASDIVKKYAPVVGNLTASLLGGTLFNAGNKAAGVATGEQSPNTQAYANLDITPRMAGDVSGNPFLRQAQNIFAKLPGGFGPTERAAQQTADEWGNALDRTARTLDPLGISRTEETVGTHMQARANNWLDTFRARNQINANNLDMQIPGATPTPTTNYRDALNEIRTDIPTAEATRSVLEPDLNRRLLDSLTTDTRIPARDTGLVDASGRPIITPEQTRDLTWADVQGIRKRIGERLSEPAAYDTPDIGKLKQLYAALSNDQETLANGMGAPARDAFNTMRDYARNGHDFIDTALSKIVKGDTIAPAQATRNVMNTAPAGGTMLNQLRGELPDVVDALGAWKLRDAALANKGQQSAQGNRQSPGTFLTDMNGLSSEAQTALYGHNPQVASNVYDLRQVAGGMKDTTRYSNPSGTSPMERGADILT